MGVKIRERGGVNETWRFLRPVKHGPHTRGERRLKLRCRGGAKNTKGDGKQN